MAATNQDRPEGLLELLRDINNGDFIHGASKQLKAVIAAIKEAERNIGGKPKGKLIIALDFTLDRGVIDIGANVKIAEPAKVNGRAVRYGTEDGALMREDPAQHLLPLTQGHTVRDGIPDVRAER